METYTTGRATRNTGATAGLYWRPQPLLRLDVHTGRVLGGTTGTGLALRLG